ncbi:MAG TPA: hypothetical protein DEP23_12685 [Ruminococcaceae bacterium]|nr:hypothetical protein [Oscillospiraceae bacterium]
MGDTIHSSIIASAVMSETNTAGGMIFAGWAIMIVLLAMAFVFLRCGKKEYAVAILPLLITPFFYIISGVIARLFDVIAPFSIPELRVIITISAGLISCLLLGLASKQISGLRTRHVFFWSCAAFVIVLTLVFVSNMLIAAR